jgi:hypothetical protein
MEKIHSKLVSSIVSRWHTLVSKTTSAYYEIRKLQIFNVLEYMPRVIV